MLLQAGAASLRSQSIRSLAYPNWVNIAVMTHVHSKKRIIGADAAAATRNLLVEVLRGAGLWMTLHARDGGELLAIF